MNIKNSVLIFLPQTCKRLFILATTRKFRSVLLDLVTKVMNLHGLEKSELKQKVYHSNSNEIFE